MVKLEKACLFLGYNWLQKHNSVINWSKSILLFKRCPFYGRRIFWDREPEEKEKETKEQEEQIVLVNVGERIVGRQKNDQEVSFEEQVSKEYWKYHLFQEPH